MQHIKDLLKPGSTLARLMEGLKKTSEVGQPEYCVFCGKEKYEYTSYTEQHPRTMLLDCDCEKVYKELKKEINYWVGKPVPVKMQDYVAMIKRKYDQMLAIKEKHYWENKREK